METGSEERSEPGHGGHYLTAVTGSGNSEYLIKWTSSVCRRLGAAWTVIHVRNPKAEKSDEDLERNLSLAKDLGAELLSVADTEVAAAILGYARIKGVTALVIGKAEEGDLSFLGRRSIMGDILRDSGDLDLIVLRGKTPVPPRPRQFRLGRSLRAARGGPLAALCLLAVTSLGLLAQPALGYRSISILYLLTIIALPFACGRLVVFASAAASALLWNFLFIPPRMTFSITSLEDFLMFLAFFLAAFVGGYLTSRLKENESALALRERRMAFLYGFTRGISRVRGVGELVRFAGGYLEEHLALRSSVYLRREDGSLARENGGELADTALPEEGGDLAARCLAENAGIEDERGRLYLPLGSAESLLGVLLVQGKTSHTIHGELRELLSALAGNLALALGRETLSAENERNKMGAESARLSKILLNHVSHELRTPLTTIKGSVSGLLEGSAAEDPQLRAALLGETMIAANKLNVVVEDLLAMSRLEAGKLRPHPELAYLSELIGAAQQSMGVELQGRSIKLEDSAMDFELETDPVLMVQVFRNILRNFVAYTDADSALRIEARGRAGGASIRFSDDGPGVPDRELPFLFDTFYRGSRGAARPGCGLGLSICRGIVEVHGGSIEASRSPEGGLLLSIELPRRETP